MRATPGQKCAVSVTLGSLQQETEPSPVVPVVLVPSLTHQVRTAPGEEFDNPYPIIEIRAE